MPGGKGKSSGGKSSGGKTSADGSKKQQSHSARAGLQVRNPGFVHVVLLCVRRAPMRCCASPTCCVPRAIRHPEPTPIDVLTRHRPPRRERSSSQCCRAAKPMRRLVESFARQVSTMFLMVFGSAPGWEGDRVRGWATVVNGAAGASLRRVLCTHATASLLPKADHANRVSPYSSPAVVSSDS